MLQSYLFLMYMKYVYRSLLASSPPLWLTPAWATTASTDGQEPEDGDSNPPATDAASESVRPSPALPGVPASPLTHGEVLPGSDPPPGVLASDQLRSARLSPASPGVLALLVIHGEALPMLDAPSGDLESDPSRSVRPRPRLSPTGAMADTVKQLCLKMDNLISTQFTGLLLCSNTIITYWILIFAFQGKKPS